MNKRKWMTVAILGGAALVLLPIAVAPGMVWPMFVKGFLWEHVEPAPGSGGLSYLAGVIARGALLFAVVILVTSAWVKATID